MTFTLIPNRNLTVVTSDCQVLTIHKDNPNWEAILECVKLGDEAGVVRLMNLRKTIEDFGTGVEGRGEIKVVGDKVLYRDEPLYGEDITRIKEYLSMKFPVTSMIKFLERKMKNPSRRSIESLYGFLSHQGMPITDNGTFLGYKGVLGDFSSRNTGSEPLIKGQRLPNGSIFNGIGETIEMERRYVCDDFNQPCGPGLHAGSLEYATSWAGEDGRVVIVEIDPANVVSVPKQETNKLRITSYRVVGEYVGKLSNTYNNEYVRPEEISAPTPEEVVTSEVDSVLDEDHEDCPNCGNCITCDMCECEVNTDVVTEKKTGVKLADTPQKQRNQGYKIGVKHGKSHQKRLYYEIDRATKNPFIEGYLNGYKVGRGNS
jgi:hypothetical protein